MNSKRVLAIYYSQTGKVQSSVETLLKPVVAEGHTVFYVPLRVKTALPFPWGFFRFFGIFPETVLGPPMPIEPPGIPPGKFDLVIVGFPIWFLSCPQPLQSFFDSDGANVLRQTPTIALIACRELWHQGFLDFKRRLKRLDASLIDKVIVKEPMGSLLSYIDTPIFLITGKKLVKPNHKSLEQLEKVSQLGYVLAKTLSESETAPLPIGKLERFELASTTSKNLALEIIGKRSFVLWATVIKRLAPPTTVRRRLAISLFFIYLCVAIPALKVLGGFIQLLTWFVCPKQLQLYRNGLNIRP